MTTWDLQSAPVTLLVDLAARGVLTVSTSAFDALVKAGGGSDLDAAKKYRIDGESARPVQVVTSE
jgi:alcohol dehydrogenase class IV